MRYPKRSTYVSESESSTDSVSSVRAALNRSFPLPRRRPVRVMGAGTVVLDVFSHGGDAMCRSRGRIPLH